MDDELIDMIDFIEPSNEEIAEKFRIVPSTPAGTLILFDTPAGPMPIPDMAMDDIAEALVDGSLTMKTFLHILKMNRH